MTLNLSPARSTLVLLNVMYGNFSASKKSPVRRWPSRCGSRVSTLATSICASACEAAGFLSSKASEPFHFVKKP